MKSQRGERERKMGVATPILIASLGVALRQQPVWNGEIEKSVNSLDAQARQIADQLRCPVCRGVPISESPSPLAQDMMAVIRQKLSEGKTPEAILDYFTEHYGEWILLKPKPQGLNWIVWILPAVVFLSGAVLLTLAIRRWSRSQ